MFKQNPLIFFSFLFKFSESNELHNEDHSLVIQTITCQEISSNTADCNEYDRIDGLASVTDFQFFLNYLKNLKISRIQQIAQCLVKI